MNEYHPNEVKNPNNRSRYNIVFHIVKLWILLLLLEFVVFAGIAESTGYQWHIAIGAAAVLAGTLVFYILDDEWIENLRERTSISAIVAVGGSMLFCWPFLVHALRRGLTSPHLLFLSAGCSHAQLRKAFWYADLIGPPYERFIARHCPLDRLTTLFAAAGFQGIGRLVPVAESTQQSAHWDPRSVLRAEVRAGDSVWSVLDQGELDLALARIRELDERGRLDSHCCEREDLRREVGQFTFVYGQKQVSAGA